MADELAWAEPPFLLVAEVVEDPERGDTRAAVHHGDQFRLLRISTVWYYSISIAAHPLSRRRRERSSCASPILLACSEAKLRTAKPISWPVVIFSGISLWHAFWPTEPSLPSQLSTEMKTCWLNSPQSSPNNLAARRALPILFSD
jgi:hypothetical protein